jgi:hypothetical protein
MKSLLDLNSETTLFTMTLALIGGAGILFFWLIGMGQLVFDRGHFIYVAESFPIYGTLFWAYPIVFVLSAVAAAGLFLGKRFLEAVALSGFPLVAFVTVYLIMTVHAARI